MTSLRIDLSAPSRPNNPIWSFGGSVGQPPLLMRKDFRRHVMMCRDELGFRHIALEGVLADDGGPFDFNNLEPALDWLLENGIVPFLHAAPPISSDAGRWRERVTALVTHVDGRYGCDAREWYFEVGMDGAGPGAAGGQVDFTAFDQTVRAIKKVHPEYRAGWRVADADASLDALMRHVATPVEEGSAEQNACDFVTIDGGGDIRQARQKLSSTLGQGTPLIVVGYDAAGGPVTPAGDECNRAAQVSRMAVELSDVCQGIICRNVSDIDVDASPNRGHAEPFHGGRGLITVNDVRKSAFNALRLMNEHAGYHGERLEPHWTDAPPGLGCLATRSETTLRLLFWLHRAPGVVPARFTLDGIPPSVSQAQIEVIRPEAGSAYEAWVKLGKPPFINRDVLDTLELAGLAAQANVDFREYPPRLEPGMVMQLTINLPWEPEEVVNTD